MKKLNVRFTHNPGKSEKVGILAEDHGRVFFEYDPDFLDSGYSLSPFQLPFEGGLFEHKDHQFGQLPGVFDDSLPDGWGLLLMDRHFHKLNLNPAGTSGLDRLSWLGTRTMGALTYHPAENCENLDVTAFNLHNMAYQSQEILAGKAKDILPQLLRAGGSPGGARPKVLVGFNPVTGEIISGEEDLAEGYEHWIIKFSTRIDANTEGVIEYAYSLMAASAGINIPVTKLFETSEGDRFFGIKRFDRNGNQRFHIHTFGNLIQANFRIPSADYTDYLKATSLLTRNHQEVLQAFRRMIFNILAHNRDDHVKNFSYLLNDQTNEWSLSPAYDLLYTSGINGEHTMSIAGEGKNPEQVHIFKLAKQVNVSKQDTERIITEVQSAIVNWPTYAAKAGVSQTNTDRIALILKKIAGL
jgi:serine/threonine-protein kinase HipA